MTLTPVPVTLRQLLVRALKESPRHTVISIGGTMLWALMTVVWAACLGFVTNTVIVPALHAGEVPQDALWRAALLLLGVGALNGLGVFGRRYGSYTYTLLNQARHRQRVALHYLKLPVAWHRSQPAGDLISRVASDGRTVTAVLAPFSMAFGMIIMLICAYIYLATVDWVVLAFAIVMVPVLLTINSTLNRALEPLANDASAAVGTLTGAINESADAALAIRVLGRRQEENDRITPLTKTVQEKRTAMAKLFPFFDLAFQAIPALATFGILALGVWRMQSGHVNAGDVVAITYLMSMINAPLRVLGFFFQEIPKSLAGLGRIDAVLEVDDRAIGGERTLDPKSVGGAHVQMYKLSYRHPVADGTDPANAHGVMDINLNIHPGETIAIVGKTGSGKSTLVNLLAGLLPAQDGEIMIDDTPIQSLTSQDRAAVIGTAFQAPFLFNESLKENITLGSRVSEDRLWAAMEIAQIHRFAADVGVDTHVGERGASLSGGQRQRIALARALVRQPRLLILDDATSAVDANVEAAILAGLHDAHSSGYRPTTVIVAYRLGSILLADRVVFMADGRIRAIGTHEELISQDPAYEAFIRSVEVEH